MASTSSKRVVAPVAPLPDDLLRATGLSRGDSDAASDHRPIVVDLAWRR